MRCYLIFELTDFLHNSHKNEESENQKQFLFLLHLEEKVGHEVFFRSTFVEGVAEKQVTLGKKAVLLGSLQKHLNNLGQHISGNFGVVIKTK